MMKNLMPFLLILILVPMGCGISKEVALEEVNETPKARLVDDLGEFEDSSPVNILNVTLGGNNLIIDISYSGGCEEHSFDLIGSKTILKSLPPKRGIMLYHNNNGDSCRELIKATLTFNISSFAYENGEIILMLEGYKEDIRYTLEK